MALFGQAIILSFFALVARGNAIADDRPDDGQQPALGRLGLALLALLASGLMRRPWGVTLGWVVQALTWASALLVPPMLGSASSSPRCGSCSSSRAPRSTEVAQREADAEAPGPRAGADPRPVTRVGRVTTERSLVLVKPDGFPRGLTGEVLRRIEAKGYRLVALQVLTPDLERLAVHYEEHVGKPFYEPLVDFMGPARSPPSSSRARTASRASGSLAGATNPTEALPGTIRGDFGRDWGTPVQQNIVHGSDSHESAEREIAIWFPQL